MKRHRTKRLYAHELYPHPEEGEVRPLRIEVPYLYARAVGLDVWGTSWSDMLEGDALKLASDRIMLLRDARQVALLADALHQGLTGDEAWAWAIERNDETGEIVYDRAAHYGVPIDRIKPYPCGPEPDHHDHVGEPDGRGWRSSDRIDCKESDCPDCTEAEAENADKYPGVVS